MLIRNPSRYRFGAGSELLSDHLSLAARLGLEPRQNESESFVLPLHHRAVTIKLHGGNFVRASPKKRGNGLPALARESEGWSRRWDSNPQPPVYKTGALPLSYAGVALLRNRTKVNWQKTESWWLPGDSNPEPID